MRLAGRAELVCGVFGALLSFRGGDVGHSAQLFPAEADLSVTLGLIQPRGGCRYTSTQGAVAGPSPKPENSSLLFPSCFAHHFLLIKFYHDSANKIPHFICCGLTKR